MDLSFNKNERSGLIGTIVFHILLILLFLFTGLSYMEPPPPEQGILINFGTEDEGSGDVQTQSSVKSEQVSENEELKEDVPARSTEQKMITQNSEEAPSVSTKESESIRKEEIVKEEPKPSKELSDAVSKWKNKADGKSASDGITGKQGDQGDESGSPNSRNYTGGSGGDGFSFNLGGRSMVTKPVIKDQSQEEGKVIVDIIVDKNGNVVRANPGARGSTTASQVLYKIAREAAMTTRFNISPNSPEQQKGQITFIFLVKG